MSTNRDPMPSADAGQKVWEVVEASGEVGVRGEQVREETGLKRSQFENGKCQVRDYKAAEEGKSFVYDGDVYVITKDPGRCAKAVAHRMRTIDRQLQRLYASTCQPLDEHTINSDPALPYLKRQVEAILDNLALLRKVGYSVESKQVRATTEARSR
ncbi:MAG TPA: hypothetical protein VK001_11460 [Geminicoccaceae bacterium]|nr:hypothetical protein [Geminicoccaceae bacterium]